MNNDASGMVSYPSYASNNPSTGDQELGYAAYPASKDSSTPYSQAVADFATSRLYEKVGYGSLSSSTSRSISSRNRYFEHRGWRNNSLKDSSSESESKTFYCEMCKISCVGKTSYKAHCDGFKHKRKEESIKNNKPIASSAVTIMCEVCDIPCSGPEAYNAHIVGSKHQKVLKLHAQLGKPVPELSLRPLPKTSLVTPTPGSAVKVSGTPRINFVDGGNSSTNKNTDDALDESHPAKATSTEDGELADTGSSARPPKPPPNNPVETADGYVVPSKTWDESVEPIGIEHVKTETGEDGRPSFFCTICDCKIGDPASREQHVRGKKHKFQYMKKIDRKYPAENPNTFPDKKPSRLVAGQVMPPPRFFGYSPYARRPQGYPSHPNYYGGYGGMPYPGYGWSPRIPGSPYAPRAYYGPPSGQYYPPSYGYPHAAPPFDYYWPPPYPPRHAYPYYPHPLHRPPVCHRPTLPENSEVNESDYVTIEEEDEPQMEDQDFEPFPRMRRHSV